MGYSWFDIDWSEIAAAHRLPAAWSRAGTPSCASSARRPWPTAPIRRGSGWSASARAHPWPRPARWRGRSCSAASWPTPGGSPGGRCRPLPAPGLAGFPVLWQHGRADPVVPVAFGHEARDVLGGLGLRLDYREYPIGHEISEESLRDLGGWLTRPGSTSRPGRLTSLPRSGRGPRLFRPVAARFASCRVRFLRARHGLRAASVVAGALALPGRASRSRRRRAGRARRRAPAARWRPWPGSAGAGAGPRRLASASGCLPSLGSTGAIRGGRRRRASTSR